MTTTAELKKAMGNWAVDVGNNTTHCPQQVKFVTGNFITDAKLHCFETDSGVELTLTKNFTDIAEWKIVNEPKFTWFMLRWSR